jgi:hypothetical protein
LIDLNSAIHLISLPQQLGTTNAKRQVFGLLPQVEGLLRQAVFQSRRLIENSQMQHDGSSLAG